MAKQLSDILKGKDKKLEGVNSSKERDGSTGSKPYVDYEQKAKGEQDFVKKHKTQEWEGRAGNKEDVFNGGKIKKSLDDVKNARLRPSTEKVYEEASCNHSKAGVECEMHGMKACPKKIEEVLTKSTPASEYIKDFEKSDNPKFAGKSKEKRKEMGLAAYYAKQRDESAELASESRAWVSAKQVEKDMPRKNTQDYSKSSDPEIQRELDRITSETSKSFPNRIKERSNRITAALNSPIKEAKDDTEEEVSMVTTELRAIAAKVEELLKDMPDDMHVEPWVQTKLAMAKANISGIHDYILYKDVKEEIKKSKNKKKV